MANEQPQLPRVAAIVANYNNGQYIVDAIKGLVLSDYPAKTIVIVDDCSTDNSASQILDLCGNQTSGGTNDDEKSISVHSINNVPILFIQLKKNSGPSRARNMGIKSIFESHQLFLIADADDVVLPTKMSEFVAKFLENPEMVGGVYADYIIVNENGINHYESKEPYSIQRLAQDCIIHSQCMFSTLALQKVGLFDESLITCEDYDLHLRVSDHFVYIHIPKPLTFVRTHKDNSTNSVSKEIWENNYRQVKYNLMKRKGMIA